MWKYLYYILLEIDKRKQENDIFIDRNWITSREVFKVSSCLLQRVSLWCPFLFQKKEESAALTLDQLLFYIITADLNWNRNEFTPRFGPQTEEVASSRFVLEKSLGFWSELKQNTWGCCCLHPWWRKVNRRKRRHVWTRCGWRDVDSVSRHNSEMLRGHHPLSEYKILKGRLANATKQEFQKLLVKAKKPNSMYSRRRNLREPWIEFTLCSSEEFSLSLLLVDFLIITPP